MKTYVPLILLSALMMIGAGCATPALWGRKEFFPRDIRLLVSPDSGDVLVCYNDTQPDSTDSTRHPDQIQARAYWLRPSTNTFGQHPAEFVNVTTSSNWISVPFVILRRKEPAPAPPDSAGSTNSPNFKRIPHSTLADVVECDAPPERGYYAIQRWPGFELWRDGEEIGTFNFPHAYTESALPTFLRVVLTPLAATADAAIVVVVVGVESGAVQGLQYIH
jgi:hypothetical protein